MVWANDVIRVGRSDRYGFTFWIYRGLAWIISKMNSLMIWRIVPRNVIWRCIFQPPFQRYWAAAFQRGVESKGDHLKVLYECRPYELGWLLYAFGDRKDDVGYTILNYAYAVQEQRSKYVTRGT